MQNSRISHQPRRRFSPVVASGPGSGLSSNGEYSGRRVQSSRDSYECAQRFFSMPQRQSTEDRHPHRCKMFAQQINDGERIGRLKSRELTDGYSCKAVEMPGLAEHRQLSINLPHIHVNCFNKQNGSVQRWKSPPGSRTGGGEPLERKLRTGPSRSRCRDYDSQCRSARLDNDVTALGKVAIVCQ
jgi:hypothetical protein